MRKVKYFHLFCFDCQRGWHFANLNDVLLMERVHIQHKRLSNPVALRCGPECANDWEMCKNANL